MNANAEVLPRSEAVGLSTPHVVPPRVEADCTALDWDPEDFAREQVRGLVRRVFFGKNGRPVKQVVFSAAEPHLDVGIICERIAAALARETRAHVALVGGGQAVRECGASRPASLGMASVKSWSAQIATNLWQVPRSGLEEYSEESGTGIEWVACLEHLRKQFEYVVIQGPTAGTSSEAALLGQLTDGIILVLGARKTRRATAQKIKETLEGAQCRILGSVLVERTFPMPESIYRLL